MPLYEFNCNSCNHEFEDLQLGQKFMPNCPRCGSTTMPRSVPSSFAIGGSNPEQTITSLASTPLDSEQKVSGNILHNIRISNGAGGGILVKGGQINGKNIYIENSGTVGIKATNAHITAENVRLRNNPIGVDAEDSHVKIIGLCID